MGKLSLGLVIIVVCFQLLALSSPAAPGGRCTSNEFQCDDGSCIKSTYRCDGEADCQDRSDESPATCTPTTTTTSSPSCPANRWQCNDGSCIKSKDKCDGESDCADGSDESPENCVSTTARPTCPITKWQCESGACIKPSDLCDGSNDCSDGSDELPRNCPSTTTTTAMPTCAPNQFQCNDGSCIKLSYKCDNEPECADGSDESPQICNAAESERRGQGDECNEDEIACNDGNCIKVHLICNGVDNCAGGEDEQPEICKTTGTNTSGHTGRSDDYEELCSPRESQCPDLTCIPKSLVCDGHYDCSGGEDESLEICSTHCTDNEFQCNDRCIDINYLCDGTSDCDDESDELPENCLDTSAIEDVVDRSARIELPPPRSYEDEQVIDDILNLIKLGEDEIDLRPDIRDLVLMVGNTGAGKTTMTKFLTTDNTRLESYLQQSRYLIRDYEGDISTTSTMISKTMFPALMIDPATSTAFYDLPGFSDTRSPTIEIVNAYFMKKVADHARKVKFIFIVNHSSLRDAGSRTDLKLLLDQATDFIKNPDKFRRGMALVASKVEVEEPEINIYRHISQFLNQSKRDLPLIFQDEDKLVKCEEVLDAFLTTAGGPYSRLAMFKQPKKAGRLDTLMGVQSTKPKMRRVVFENTQFVPSSPDDFGISISPKAQLFVLNLEDKIKTRMTTLMVNIGNRLIEAVNNFIAGESQDPNSAILRSYFAQEEFTGVVDVIQRANTTEEFFSSLSVFNETIGEDVFVEIISNITREYQHLTMLHELIPRAPLKFPKSEWMRPIQKVKEHVDSTTYKLAQTVNERLSSLNTHIFQDLLTRYDELVNVINSTTPEEFLDNGDAVDMLAADSFVLEQLVQIQNEVTTVWEFYNVTVEALGLLNIVKIASPETVASLQDLPFESYDHDFGNKPSPFEVEKWKLLVHELSAYLSEQIAFFTTRAHQLGRDIELAAAQRNYTETAEEIQANSTLYLQQLQGRIQDLQDQNDNFWPNVNQAKAFAEESAATIMSIN